MDFYLSFDVCFRADLVTRRFFSQIEVFLYTAYSLYRYRWVLIHEKVIVMDPDTYNSF